MSWVKIDDQMGYHAKVVRAGNAAFGAWVRMLTWTCAQLTDGLVPDEIAEGFAKQSELKKLVEVRLLDRVDGGYTIHDFLEWNPSASDVRAKRASDNVRKGIGRQKQGRNEKGQVTSSRNPNGIRTESERNPSGIQADSSRNPNGIQAPVQPESTKVSTGPTPTPTPTPTPDPPLAPPGGGGAPSGPGEPEPPHQPPTLRPSSACLREARAELMARGRLL